MLYISIAIIIVVMIGAFISSQKNKKLLKDYKIKNRNFLKRKVNKTFLIKNVLVAAVGFILFLIVILFPELSGGKDDSIYKIFSIGLSFVALVNIIFGNYNHYIYYTDDNFFVNGKTIRYKNIRKINSSPSGATIELFNDNKENVTNDFANGLKEIIKK